MITIVYFINYGRMIDIDTHLTGLICIKIIGIEPHAFTKHQFLEHNFIKDLSCIGEIIEIQCQINEF